MASEPNAASATRDPSQIPFASDSVFNLPLGSGAQWTPNAQLAGASIVINAADSGWNEPIYTGTASDPVVTVTNSGASTGGPGGTYKVHISAGAQPSSGGDSILSVDDTVTHQWASFGGFQWTSATTATASQGSSESDFGSGLQFDNSNQDEGVGTLRESDLQAGSINHMLRIELPDDMLKSVSSSAYQLAANAWPQTEEDGFGPSQYSGTVPFGVTIGIPASAVEPAAVKANAGADMLWHELQDHGAMIRDSGGSGNGVIFQTDQNVSANDPLIQGMEQFGSQIMSQVQILANQGPGSINGGGTPIVPLDPAPSDAAGSPPSGGGGTGTGGGTQPSADGVLTPTSGGSLTDASGNAWTLTAGGAVDENGNPVPGGGGTEALTISSNTIYGEDAGGTGWYTYDPSTQYWTASPAPPNASGGGSPPPPPPPPSIVLDPATDPQPTITASNTDVSGVGSFTAYIGGTGDTVSLSGGNERVMLFGGNDTVTTGAGDDTIYMASKGNIVATGTGHDAVIDSAGGNTVALPSSGNYLDLWGQAASADALDFRPMLAGTAWKAGDKLVSFVKVSTSGTDAVISVSQKAGGAGVAVATLHGQAGISLAALHVLT